MKFVLVFLIFCSVPAMAAGSVIYDLCTIRHALTSSGDLLVSAMAGLVLEDFQRLRSQGHPPDAALTLACEINNVSREMFRQAVVAPSADYRLQPNEQTKSDLMEVFQQTKSEPRRDLIRALFKEIQRNEMQYRATTNSQDSSTAI